MIVEDDVFISGGVLTANDNRIGREGYEASAVVGPHIERGVALGAGSIVLPAVRVGRGATVAAGAVVTRDVASNETVFGMPAQRRVRDAK